MNCSWTGADTKCVQAARIVIRASMTRKLIKQRSILGMTVFGQSIDKIDKLIEGQKQTYSHSHMSNHFEIHGVTLLQRVLRGCNAFCYRLSTDWHKVLLTLQFLVSLSFFLILQMFFMVPGMGITNCLNRFCAGFQRETETPGYGLAYIHEIWSACVFKFSGLLI